MVNFRQKRTIWNNKNLLFGHVQQSNGVPLAVEIGPNGVESFVKLSLNISELFKYFIG